MQDGHVVIVGGHGKVALLAAQMFRDAGVRVASVFRNPDHRDDVVATGADPVVLDIEDADTDTLAEVFDGAAAVVFSAGAGGGNPARTHAVDFEAAVRTMEAATRAGVRRYVMVSYISAQVDVDHLDPQHSFFPYAKAKHDADAHLRGTDLDFTILGPGRLTLDAGTAMVRVVDGTTVRTSGVDTATSRANVARAIVHVVTNDAGIRRTYAFTDGDTPIAEALV